MRSRRRAVSLTGQLSNQATSAAISRLHATRELEWLPLLILSDTTNSFRP